MKKTKFDYEVDSFVKVFSRYKEKKIVLYGTGRMTATLIERVKDFNIIGLCDRDEELIGTYKYGIRILSRQEVEREAELLIINTSSAYWNTIFKRIKNWSVPIYYVDGSVPVIRDKEEWKKEPVFHTSFEELEKKAENYSIVSFDIFDTIFIRRLITPFDVFSIVDSNCSLKNANEFVNLRKQAAASLDNPTIDEIYDKMLDISEYSKQTIEDLKKLEYEVEKNVLQPRKVIAEFCKKLITQKKKIIFVSDMYFPSSFIHELLLSIGIVCNIDQIYVSCEYRATKEKGDLWQIVWKDVGYNNRILHIGDNELGDNISAVKNGVDSYRIMSLYEMIEKSPFADVLSEANELYLSVTLGLIAAKLFNNPFILNKSSNEIQYLDEVEAAYIIFGPLMDNFFRWIINSLQNAKYDSLAFFSREGFLLVRLYNEIIKILNVDNMPIGKYLEISRRVVGVSMIRNLEDAKEWGDFPYDSNKKDFFVSRFGIKKDIDLTTANKEELIEIHISDILDNASRERNNYLKYYDSLKLGNVAYVDSQYYGTTQYYLSKILQKRTRCYYFCACMDKDNRNLKNNEMLGCYSGADSSVHKQAPMLEAFFTSPEGMMIKVNDSGEKVYAKKMKNQTYFNVRESMMSGIIDYFKDMNSCFKGCKWDNRSSKWIDTMFGISVSDVFNVPENMQNAFFFDNKIVGDREAPIWR